jgi:hypothetical protein
VPSLRVLSVNAAALPADRDGLARLIAAEAPDVACVQGSPSLLRWRSISAALGRKAGLVVVSGGRTGGANLILSTLGVDVVATADVRFDGGTFAHPTGATLAVLRRSGSEFVLGCARLIGNSAERLAQSGEFLRALAGLVRGDLPSVLCVDGADRPGTASWAALSVGRVGTGGGVFVDTRLALDPAADGSASRPQDPQTTVSLALPEPSVPA